ncbi:hypothetical protein MLD38_024062 [Melastoma candidum]|uniref:Uncharacterized protein n=1 Tax=Melastoma candidum TaxID=119954 RepID=A0ACB9NSQ0_9MYRT|nr:hypothetical protein MLD38_024062 [Melastoma candidum]
MDSYEATRVVFSRIQSLDPENASKIMGILLIQDHGEKEMIRLAFGPETLLHSLVVQARKELGLPPSSSPSSPSPSPPSLFHLPSTKPISVSRQSSSSLASSWVNSSASAATTSFPELPKGDDLGSSGFLPMHGSSPPSSSLFGSEALVDRLQLPDQLSFLNEDANTSPELLSSPTDSYCTSAAWGGSSMHRRSCSVNDACGNLDDGHGWRPCLYYSRGFCKNGSSCKFVHGSGLADPGSPLDRVGSPRELMGQCHDLLRSKSAGAQQQRLAAPQLLNSSAFPYSPKSMNLLMQHQQSDMNRAAAALMMGEDIYKLGRSRLERTDYTLNGGVNPASRQIYLTFPSDSTFKEEDVSNYFSLYGPVQDVRIPYQQKRMFGFVTFVYPETVKLILAKGNPHFVCDARVLVKPYKEKGKVPDKFRKQQLQLGERGEFSPCGSPRGLDARAGPFDIPLGPRSFYNSQDILWRKRLEEQADLQQAIELQSHRLLNLQLLDVQKHHHQRALSTGSPIPSPTHSPSLFSQAFGRPFHGSPTAAEVSENCGVNGFAPSIITNGQPVPRPSLSSFKKEFPGGERGVHDKESSNSEDGELPDIFEHNLPDSPFASPTKASNGYLSAFSDVVVEADMNGGAVASALSPKGDRPASVSFSGSSSMDMASAFKTFNCQPPRFSSGLGAMGIEPLECIPVQVVQHARLAYS